jgi:hypothetical protein
VRGHREIGFAVPAAVCRRACKANAPAVVGVKHGHSSEVGIGLCPALLLSIHAACALQFCVNSFLQ